MRMWPTALSGIQLGTAVVIAFSVVQFADAGVNVTTVHSFGALTPDGSSLYAPLTHGSDGNFYGTASGGGAYGAGTVFKMTPDGVITTLHSFTIGSDGADPRCTLVQGTNGNFYGTATTGGSPSDDYTGYGTVFMITPQGDLTTLHIFAGYPDGGSPSAGLILANDDNFYGTTQIGGAHNIGTVFQVTPLGGFKTIYSFTGGTDGGGLFAPLVQGTDGQLYGTALVGGNTSLNADGAGYGAIFKLTTAGDITPLYAFTDGNDGQATYSGLVQGLDGNFYGTAIHGTTGYGAVFQVTPSGGFNVLHDFSGNDGAAPTGTLIQCPDAKLYGTTIGGGLNEAGTIFAITTNGAFESLYSFTNTIGKFTPPTGPLAGLTQGTNGNLYGVTTGGYGSGSGAVFSVTTNGDLAAEYSFPGGGGDGAFPTAALVLDTNGQLYGTAWNGGTNGDGAVFQITTNGILSPLYSFTNGTDGTTPLGALVSDANGVLWGTTSASQFFVTGEATNGTVFKVATNGDLTTVYTFNGGSDGSLPRAGVIRGVDGNFYGTSYSGGGGFGTFFRINPTGLFTNLHTFNGGTDGGHPSSGLLQASDTNFYGTTTSGGTGFGTVFKITPEGAFSTIPISGSVTGFSPYGALIQGSDGNLYGTSSGEGTVSQGTVFRITLPGAFTNLYNFTNGIDGAVPLAGLIQASDGDFYGTTTAGGANGNGTIFKLTHTGSFQALYSFSATETNEFGFNQDGANPAASLVQAPDGSLYGVAEYGGQFGTGTIFKITVTGAAPPQFLTVNETGGVFNFTWSAEVGRQYQLQYCTNLPQANWASLGPMLPAIGSTVESSDPSPADAERFYRVVLLP